jgi:hypothetical protein
MVREILYQQFKNGDLASIKKLYQEDSCVRGVILENINSLFQIACSYGYLNLCKWLYKHFNVNVTNVQNRSNLALRWACHENKVEICEWLYSTFQLSREDAVVLDNEALKCACNQDYFKVVNFLFYKAGLQEEDAIMIMNKLEEEKKEKLLEVLTNIKELKK